MNSTTVSHDGEDTKVETVRQHNTKREEGWREQPGKEENMCDGGRNDKKESIDQVFMCLFVCVCVCVCVYVCMYVYMYVCMFVFSMLYSRLISSYI